MVFLLMTLMHRFNYYHSSAVCFRRQPFWATTETKSGLVLPRLRDIKTIMNKVIKSRRYCFTIPNYTEENLIQFQAISQACEKHHYICYGLEIAPDTGMQHIQGYIELNEAQRFTFLHNYFGLKRNGKILKFHAEIANGSASDNKKYVSKEGKFFETGEPVTQGARTDLKEIKKAIKEDPRKIKEVIDEYGNNLQQIKYAQSLQPYYFSDREPNNPPTVYWIFGPTAIGKTKLVYDTFEDICSVSSYDWLGTGYTQNECLLFDDFREFNLTFEQVLKIADRYPYTLFYKGSQIPLNSPFIIFTSPKSIDETFTSASEDKEQIRRRIIQIDLANVGDIKLINLRNLDEKYIYKDNANYSHPF